RVYCCVLAPDGKLLAFGGQLNYVVLYEVATGRELRRPTGLPGAVSSLAFAPDSRTLATGDWRDGVTHLWEVATGQRFRQLSGHPGRALGMAFSADGSLLVTASADTTALVWDVTGQRLRPRPAKLLAEEWEARWQDLSAADAVRAQDAMTSLVAAAGQTVPLLRERLRPVPPVGAKDLARLIAALDSDRFAEREAAQKELGRLGEVTAAALREALAGSPSLDARRRMEQLLQKQEAAERFPSAERLRELRALQVVERIGNPEARRVLEGLAQGAPGARLTQDARAALGRLAGR